MSATVEAPVDLMEAIAHLQLPPQVDAELQKLMDANTRGKLTPPQRGRLESLVEWSESVSLLRARALHLLRDSPV